MSQAVRSNLNVFKYSSYKLSGFTLIELMISSVLASLLAIICFNMFFASSTIKVQSSVVVDGMLETASVLSLIQETVEFAGYNEQQPVGMNQNIFFPQTALFSAGQVLRITNDNDIQKLIVRFKAPSIQPIYNCKGELLASDIEYVREISLDDKQLMCRDLSAIGGVNAETMISDQIMRLHFKAILVDSTNNNLTRVKQSVALNDKDSVRGVQLIFLVESKAFFYADEHLTKVEFDGFENFINTSKFQYLKHAITINTKNANLII